MKKLAAGLGCAAGFAFAASACGSDGEGGAPPAAGIDTSSNQGAEIDVVGDDAPTETEPSNVGPDGGDRPLSFSVNVDEAMFAGTVDSCIIDGGTKLLQTVFQATGSGETADGEPFNILIGQYLHDSDGDGVQDTQMQLSVEVGRASAEGPAPTGEIYLSGKSNDAAHGAVGMMEATLGSNGVVDGFGVLNDFSGILAAPDEPLHAVFHVECGSGD